MMTKIGWTKESWNPIVGCSKVSAGCMNCYAEKMAYRLVSMGNADYATVINSKGQWIGNTHFVEPSLEKPLHWKRPREIFVCSMSDLFHETVPFEWIDRVFAMMAGCEKHTFQILTKRPERMLKYYNSGPGGGLASCIPLSNVWLGVSAENQEMANKRIPILLDIPAAKRFVSIEPMLESLSINDMNIDWVIVGCESGPKRRPCKLEWVENVVFDCIGQGVPVFVKQLEINGKVEHDMSKFPKHVQHQEKAR